jgi:hypothetical protein
LVGVAVAGGVLVGVAVGVLVEVLVGAVVAVGVLVGVAVAGGVLVGVAVGVLVEVLVGAVVAVGVFVGVAVAVGVLVEVAVGVEGGTPSALNAADALTIPAPQVVVVHILPAGKSLAVLCRSSTICARVSVGLMETTNDTTPAT